MLFSGLRFYRDQTRDSQHHRGMQVIKAGCRVPEAMLYMNKLKRAIYLFLGIGFVALGINLFLQSELGSDPLTVLQQGMHLVFGISVGQASLTYNIAILLVAVLFAKKGLGIGTVAYILLLGSFIDIFALLFDLLWVLPHTLPLRLAAVVLGQVSVSLGYALVIHAKLGTSGLDAVLLEMERRMHISYRVLRTIADVIFALAGALMGGVIGIGTALSMLTNGFMVSFFRRMLSPCEQDGSKE